MSLCKSGSDGVISMDLVKNSVLNDEMKRRSNPNSSRSDVLVTVSLLNSVKTLVFNNVEYIVHRQGYLYLIDIHQRDLHLSRDIYVYPI